MTLRPDEKFVLKRIVDFLGGPGSVYAREGEDPPDAYVEVEGVTNLLEITQLSQFIVNPDGSIATRMTQDMFGLRLIEELDREYSEIISDDICLLIHMKVPVTQPAKFKKGLKSALGDLIRTGSYTKILDVEGQKVRIRTISSDAGEGKRIVGLVQSTNSSADILANAKLILDNRLSIKNDICSRLPFQGSIWLGLFNQYWLADAGTFQLALKQSEVSHQFEKVFFVQDTGDVEILYSET